MTRSALVALAIVTLLAPARDRVARRAWPLRMRIAGAAGGAPAFRVIASGDAQLVTFVEGSGTWWSTSGAPPAARPLASGDTLRAKAPAEYPVALRGGTLTLWAAGGDVLDVVVTHVGGGAVPVAAHGRRLVVRDSAGLVVVDAR